MLATFFKWVNFPLAVVSFVLSQVSVMFALYVTIFIFGLSFLIGSVTYGVRFKCPYLCWVSFWIWLFYPIRPISTSDVNRRISFFGSKLIGQWNPHFYQTFETFIIETETRINAAGRLLPDHEECCIILHEFCSKRNTSEHNRMFIAWSGRVS